jgi:hypothetical protein
MLAELARADLSLTVDKLFSEQSRSLSCSEPAQNETFRKRVDAEMPLTPYVLLA